MDAERWKHLSELMERILDLPEQERSRFLDEHCAGDRGLRTDLEGMLDEGGDSGFLQPPQVLDAAARLPIEATSPMITGTPKWIGDYRVLREIGRGGMGIVYEAIQAPLGRRVALKLLPDSRLASETDLARFRRESETASRLEHPNICAVYDAGVVDGRPFIAMRFVEGETLAARLSRARARGKNGEPADVRESIALVEQLARALHAAHEAGVVHRDVKPGNVMVTQEDVPLLLDFGLALDTDSGSDLTRTGQVPGTPAYMAPEQIAGHRQEWDRQADVYALGAVLYECLTLSPPFERPTLLALGQAILTHEPDDPRRRNSNLTTDQAAVVLAALEKDRGRRYRTALALAEDLRALNLGLPISVRPISRVGRALRWSKREPGTAAALALTLLLLVGGPTSYAVQAHRANEALRSEQDLTRVQRQRADANYRRAREAVDEITFEFARRELRGPDFAPARQGLFELGLRYYHSFIADNEGEVRVSLDVAAAQVGVGQLTHELGRSNDAIRILEESLARLESVAGTEPEDPHEVARVRSMALFWLGRAQRALGHLHAAISALEEAREVHELARPTEAEEAKSAEWSRRHSRIESELARLLHDADRTDDATALGDRSLDRLESTAEGANDLEFLRTFVTGLRGESFRHKLAGRFVEAQQVLDEGIRRIERDVTGPTRNVLRAELLSSRGQVHTAVGRFDEAEKDLRESAELIEAELDGAFEHDLALLEELGFVYAELGAGYDLQDRAADALNANQRALEIRRELVDRVPDVPAPRMLVAKTLAAVASFTVDREQARDSWEQSIEIAAALVSEYPEHPLFPSTLNSLRTYYAQQLLAWNEPDRALGLIADVVAYRRAQFAGGADSPLDRQRLGLALNVQVRALHATGGHREELELLFDEGFSATLAAFDLAPEDAFIAELLDDYAELEVLVNLAGED